LNLDTLDGEPFLAVNGVQTMSYTYVNLIGEMDEMHQRGVSHFRLSPHSGDMVIIARAYRNFLDGKMTVEESNHIIAEESDDMPFSNGFYHGKEGVSQEGLQELRGE